MYEWYELRETYGRDRDDESDESTASGLLICTFRAKKLKTVITTGYAGVGTASNDTTITLIAPYFGVEVLPSVHTVVVDGKGYIVTSATAIGKKLRIILN